MIRDLIMKGDIHAIKEIMEKSAEQGMQTFDSHLYKLYSSGRISLEEALRNADSASNLKLKINLAAGLQPKHTNTNNDAHPHDFMASLSLEPKKLEEEDAPLI